jgi:hypothetical protein
VDLAALVRISPGDSPGNHYRIAACSGSLDDSSVQANLADILLLNQAEIEISLFSRQCLGKRRIPTLAILRRESRAWNRKANRVRAKINWQFTRKKARAKFGYKRNLLSRS